MGIEVKWPEKHEPESSLEPPKKKPHKRPEIPFPLIGLVAGFLILVLAAIFLFRSKPQAAPARPPQEVATDVLNAISAGDVEQFMEHVDIQSFASAMDPTGLTRRDYTQADPARTDELKLIHAELLVTDIFISENMNKRFEISVSDKNASSAKIAVKPWLRLGNTLYRTIILEKRKNQWKVTRFAAPDA